ncbi:Fic family protein [Mollicutes bacterium LVI A0078]|nr:Fic family protein [Mollicutes bacterium LVI A0075]WOO90148.1 Fic family protein [Mollicutes bacterium LVI A0078]
MHKIESIVSQYNHSGRSDSFLKELQTNFIQDGEKVIILNNKQFIIQKIPSPLYKVISLTELQGELKRVLDHTPLVLKRLTITKLLEDEIEQTNSIENIHTNRQSVRELIAGVSDKKKRREQQIVKHYMQIFEDNITLDSPEDISNLYYSFLQDYISKKDLDETGSLFRKDGVDVVTAKNKVIHSGINGEDNIISAVDTLLSYLNNNIENIYIKVAAFHYFFGYIHPFYDGNGRMVRLITASKLHPELDIASLAISDVIANNQSIYYKMFDETNSQFNVGDITSFVYKFLEFIEEAVRTTLTHIKRNNMLIDIFNSHLNSTKLDDTNKTCLSIIYQASLVNENLSKNQLCKELDLSMPTLNKKLAQLEDNNYLTINRSVKPNIISINDVWFNTLDMTIQN